jgi:lysophospholipase
MAKNKEKSASAVEKQLRAAVKKLQAQLSAAEKSAEQWRQKAKDRKSLASGFKSELASMRRRLAKADASATKWKARARPPAPVMAPPESAPAPTSADGAHGPDDSWTVAELRAEAKRRGMSGYSRKTKGQLLADLRS